MRLIGWNNPNLWIVNQSVVINRFRWRSYMYTLYVGRKIKGRSHTESRRHGGKKSSA